MLMHGPRERTGPYRVRHYYEMEPRFYSFIRMIATFIDMVHLFAFLLQQARECHIVDFELTGVYM